jgi:hypothetical protein
MVAATSKPARRGRPPLKSGEAKRASFNTRLRNALKEHLEEAARAAGRSLSEEIESRLERSFDRTASLGGLEYEALFQMMAAAARIIEARLGKSPFSDPEASFVARSAWRQIIHNLTSNPLGGEIATEQLRIIHEMTNLKPPAYPNPKVHLGLGAEFHKISRETEENMEHYRKEWLQYEHQIFEYQTKFESLSQKLLKIIDVADEATQSGLLFPEHREGRRNWP